MLILIGDGTLLPNLDSQSRDAKTTSVSIPKSVYKPEILDPSIGQ